MKLGHIYMRWVLLLCLWVCFYFPPPLGAATNHTDKNTKFCHLSMENGLSQNTVRCMLQDSKGFIWFGTQGGVNRYDGYTFKKYTYDPGNPTTISNNFVYSMVEDRDGILWIGTMLGLNRFDPSIEQFTRYLHRPNEPTSLSNNFVRVLYLDSKGNLWIGTDGGGLDRFDNESQTFRHYKHNPDDPHSLSHDSVDAIVEDNKGNLWIGSQDGGLNYFDPMTGRFTRYHPNPHESNRLNDDRVVCFTMDQEGNLWMGTRGGGINRFEPALNCFTHYQNEPANPNSLCHNFICSLYHSSAGDLWIGTENGLSRMQLEPGGKSNSFTFTHYRRDPYNPHSLSENRVISIFEDGTGGIWLGTERNGVNRFNCGNKGFAHYRNEPGNPDSLNDNHINTIYEEVKKNDLNILWIGTRNGGLNRFDRTHHTFSYYQNDPDNPHSLSLNEVDAIGRDNSGNLWVGTHGGGLNRFDEEKKRFIRYMYDQGNPSSISSNYINSIFEDSSKDLWIGTSGGGLNRFDKAKNGFIHYMQDPDNPHSLNARTVITIYEDHSGILWIGTASGGLNRFDKTTERFTHYSNNPENPHSLSDNYILAVLQDRRGILWIGTANGGLNRFDPSTPSSRHFIYFTDKIGLPDNTIYSILEDDHGNLWLSTNRGVSKFFPDTGIFKNYDVKDGLQDNEFNLGAAFKSKTGEMFFGGNNGFNAFYPDNIRDNPHKPLVVITDFKIFNKSVPIGKGFNGRPILEKSVTYTEIVTLSYTDDVILFEYAALNYDLPERNQYEYIMEGFDRDWHHVDTRRFASYNNLPPGEYIFRVKGSNNDGVWNENGRSLKITVFPPFWRTWWFGPLVILFIISAAVFFYRQRIRNERAMQKKLEEEVARRTRELEEINAEKTRLLSELQTANLQFMEAQTDAERERQTAEEANLSKSQFLARMSHEIRTPMNGVIGFIEMLMDTELSEEQADYVKSVHTSGQVLLALINDILDFSKIEAGQLSLDQVDFDPEVTAFDVCDLIRPRMGNKPVEVICHIDQHVPANVRSDPGRFRQVLVNLMGNAAKFTETGEILLSLEVEQEGEKEFTLHTTVRDTGIGISKDNLDSIFEIFQQADGSITRQYGGSGLGLAICKQISQLMGGNVWAASGEGKGSTFHFTARVKKSERKTPPRSVRESLTGKKILVVDDNRNNLKVLTLMLQQAGIRVTALTSGKEAAQMIRKAALSGDPFHLCFLDILMPDMDGYEVAKQVRQLTAPLCDIPLLAFSSSTLKRAKYFKEGGFNAFLPKPCQRQKILDMIERLLDVKRIQKNKEKGETIITQHTLNDEAKHSVNILLVEDNALNQKLARYMLTRAGYQLEVAVNGKEAVDKYTSDPDRYDLIFMDIQMPEMNGLQATRAIREKGFKNVPIIAMTAQSLKGDREKCLEAGMDDYISKPIKRESVFQMVQKWALNKSNR